MWAVGLESIRTDPWLGFVNIWEWKLTVCLQTDYRRQEFYYKIFLNRTDSIALLKADQGMKSRNFQFSSSVHRDRNRLGSPRNQTMGTHTFQKSRGGRAVLWPWEVQHGRSMAWAWHGKCESDMATLCKSNGKQDRQCTYNVTWRRIPATVVARTFLSVTFCLSCFTGSDAHRIAKD